MIWGHLAWFVVTTLVSVALAPKPPRPRPASLDDFDFPVSEEGKPIPVIFGTVRQTGPNVIWYGDYSKTAIRKKSLGSSQVVGYKYRLGLQFLSGIGPADALTKVEVGEKEAWSGSQTTSGTITIDKPKLFGGKNREGGLKGTLEVRMGEDAQTASAYLEAKLGSPQSADRGLLTAVFRSGDSTRGGYIGNTAYPKPWAFTWRRILKGWLNDAPWYSAAAEIGTSMNPAHVIYQTLTDPEWGMGIPASSLDDTVFREAADDFLAEGFGLDLQLTQQVATEEFLQIVLDHVGGLLRFNHATGLIELKLLRGDYDPAELEIFDESRISRVTRYQRQGWGETINEIVLVYTDPTTRRETSVTVHSLGNISAQGGVVSEKLSYPGISSHDIASQVAVRELRARSTPLASLEFEIDRSAWAYTPGDVFRFSWTRLGVEEVVFRVVKAVQSELDRNVIVVSAIEDIYGLPSASFTAVPAPGAEVSDTEDTDVDESGGSVISATTTAPPGSPSDGDMYYVPTGATGAWAGHDGELAVWDADEGEWEFSDVSPGSVALDETSGDYVTLDGAGAATPAPWATFTVSQPQRVLGRKTTGEGPVEELTLSEVLDFIGSAAHGDILFRGASGWSRLAPGTAGRFLRTGGTGADPSWTGVLTGGGGFASAVQENDLVITSNASFQDTDVSVHLEPGIYAFESFYETVVNATPSMTVRIAFTGTETQIAGLRSFARGTTQGTEQFSSLPYDLSFGVTATGTTTTTGTIVVTVAGDLKMQAKQNTSSPTAVTFSKGSWIRVSQLA